VSDVVVYGATGATGSRFAEIAVGAGVRPVLAGRNRSALRAIADPLGLEVRVGSLDSDAELDAVCGGARVLLSCVAPYTTIGVPLVEAAIRSGAHYLDCSGEPRYVKRLIDQYDARARAAAVALVPSAGLGLCSNLVARAAVAGIERPERLTIDYRVRRMRPSWGTTRSTVALLAGGAAVVDGGRVRFVAPGGRVRRLAGGGTGFLFPLTDTLTCSRLWPEATIESYLRHPAAPVLAPIVRLIAAAGCGGTVARAVERLAPRRGSAEARGQFTITVTAEADGRPTTAVGDVADVYEVTSQAAFELARTLLEHGAEPGFRASGEVVGDPHETAARTGVHLRRVGQ
jgi:Saccharopine dehydrogenase NADP binding domain